MRRDNRRRKDGLVQEEQNRFVYLVIGILVLAIVAFVVSFILYSNGTDKEYQVAKQDDTKTNTVLQLSEEDNLQDTQEVSSQMGKTIEEAANEVKQEEKVAVNTSRVESKVKEEKKKQTTKTENTIEEAEVIPTNIEEKEENPTFEKPVEGKIAKGYAKDNLIYSQTLQEWTTHNGIDIEADKTTVVKTAAEGKVKSIKNDPRYGITVVVEHASGFETVYANLLSAEFVVEGEELEKGQSIGTVGNTATFEIADNTHLHFEIIQDGEYLDPELYIGE